jgi:hypothetical protein
MRRRRRRCSTTGKFKHLIVIDRLISAKEIGEPPKE